MRNSLPFVSWSLILNFSNLIPEVSAPCKLTLFNIECFVVFKVVITVANLLFLIQVMMMNYSCTSHCYACDHDKSWVLLLAKLCVAYKVSLWFSKGFTITTSWQALFTRVSLVSEMYKC